MILRSKIVAVAPAVPVAKATPLGCSDSGKQGPRVECLHYTESVWTDMRQLGLRNAVGE
jgi:MbtH protein